MKTIKLNSNKYIPALGFGTWQLKGDICEKAVRDALKTGYRHVDTADIYGNHQQVGRALKASGVDRTEIFLTTKVWRDNLRYDDVISSVQRFLGELQTDHIDLLLIHWPNHDIPVSETFKAFTELKNKGIIKTMGVSNFTIPLLEEALKINPEIVNNQVEFHPSLNQKDLKEFADKHNIVLTAYSPIAQGADLKIPIIQELAKKYKKTEAQIILNWLLKKDMVVIPRSSNHERIQENWEAANFSINDQDARQIDELKLHKRIVRPNFAPFKD